MRDYAATFAGATPDWLLRTFTDAEFCSELAREIPVVETSVSVTPNGEGTTVDLVWQVPTGRAPGIVRRALPAQVNLDWKTTWDSVGSDHHVGRLEARSAKPELSFIGTSTITAAGDAANWLVRAKAHAKHPRLIPGSLVEQLLEKVFHKVLVSQDAVAQRWLAAGR